ncbi:2-hydroxy-6-oxo-2,4-heptadienoate hydrolase [Streptomyces albus subsp. albus]|nr:2-hydroxy-6-oxo-2,4-heptadienoate hydrolase [Streptomyces albus subsp. albus]
MRAGRTVPAAGHITHFHEAGSGRPVVLLHGSAPGVSAWANWAGVLADLGADHHVLAPDLAGFGASEFHQETTYGTKLWVRQLVEFLDALELSSAVLVGNSFGGAMALAAALREPSRVDGLVLLGTPTGTFPMTEGLRAGWRYDPAGGPEAMADLLRMFPHDPACVTGEMVRERYAASARPGAQDAYRQLIPEPAGVGTPVRGVPEERLRQIAVPALVVHGREDAVIPLEVGLRAARAIPDAEAHVFGGCGHWVQLERPAAFTALVRDFLDRRLP